MIIPDAHEDVGGHQQTNDSDTKHLVVVRTYKLFFKLYMLAFVEYKLYDCMIFVVELQRHCN